MDIVNLLGFFSFFEDVMLMIQINSYFCFYVVLGSEQMFWSLLLWFMYMDDRWSKTGYPVTSLTLADCCCCPCTAGSVHPYEGVRRQQPARGHCLRRPGLRYLRFRVQLREIFWCQVTAFVFISDICFVCMFSSTSIIVWVHVSVASLLCLF